MSVLSSLEKNYTSQLEANIFLLVHLRRQVLGLMELSFSIFFVVSFPDFAGKHFLALILLLKFVEIMLLFSFHIVQCSVESLDEMVLYGGAT